MEGDRQICLLAHPDQWARCRHEDTALVPGGGVQLTWADTAAPEYRRAAAEVVPAGLTFDRWCRAYRSRPDQGRVVVETPAGDVGTSASQYPGALQRPLGLAVDQAQRLYVAESGAGAVHVVDLWGQRLLRRVSVRSAAHRFQRPVDVAASGCGVVVLLQRPAALVTIEGRRGPLPGPPLRRPRCRGGLDPWRIAGSGTALLVLWRRAVTGHGIIARPDGTIVVEVDRATDLDITVDGTVVVARNPDEAFRRYQPSRDGWQELEPVGAPGYDGGAIAIAPNGRIAFTTRTGHGWTAGAVAVHATQGRVVTYRLDGGAYRTRWGRLFVDACLPPGTDVVAQFLTSDEDDVDDAVPWQPADRGTTTVRSPDLTPTLPSESRLDALATSTQPAAPPAPLGGSARTRSMFRRPTGREWPWAQIAADDEFETYETAVAAEPGRYLWVVLTLRGTQRATPRVRAMRVERPGHRLLHHLPRAWSRSDVDADFLQRFLAPAEGLLHEMDERAGQRDVLVDPRSTPQETLNWLAGFAGLVLDRRWPERARRTLVSEAYPLFRRRGTKATLVRILQIYLELEPMIVEQWQLRGLGGAVLGTEPGGAPAPAIEGAARATGALGRFTLGGARHEDDVYSTSAHRFSVLIPADLDTEQRDVVRSILDSHRPAHTLYDICELGSGMRVGRRLHVGLTSVVGPGAGWGPAVVGQVLVGGDGVVGLPALGSRLGRTSVAGELRVG